MYCKRCWTEIPDNSEVCPNCGNEIHNNKLNIIKFFNNIKNSFISWINKYQKIIDIVGIVIVLMLSIVSGLIKSPTDRFLSDIDNNKVTAAMKIYNQKIEGDEKAEKATKNSLVEIAQNAYVDYKNEKIDYKTAADTLSSLKKTCLIDNKVIGLKSDLEDLMKSKTAYKLGLSYFNEKNYSDAILQLESVISDDNNYKQASELITKAVDNYAADIMKSSSKDLFSIKQGIDKIRKIKSVIPLNANLEKAHNSLKKSYSNQIVEKANNLVKQNKILDAISLLEESMDYDYNYILSNRKTSLENNELKTYYSNKLKQFKNSVTIKYDDIDNKYVIVPKGYKTKYININRKINIDPKIMILNGNVEFLLTVGFKQDDWIFMDKITFACDDKRYEYNIEYSHRKSQVLSNADICEWYTIVNDQEGIISDVLSYAVDMSDLVNDITNSSTNKLRFSGKGFRDHAITNAEKNNISMLWQIYQLLEQNDALIEELV